MILQLQLLNLKKDQYAIGFWRRRLFQQKILLVTDTFLDKNLKDINKLDAKNYRFEYLNTLTPHPSENMLLSLEEMQNKMTYPRLCYKKCSKI